MPREGDEAVKKRLAVGIGERLCGMDLTQEMIADLSQRSGKEAYLLKEISTLRAIDADVPPDDGQVRTILIEECAQIARHISFPGVEAGNGHEHAGQCRVLLRFARENNDLHVEGFAYEGCLIGYRKIVLDLEDGQVSEADVQSNIDDAEEYADKAYAALCDVVLGPVDQMDAWQWELEHERYRSKAASELEEAEPEAAEDKVIEEMQPSFDAITPRAKTPVMSTFHSWNNLTQAKDYPDIDAEDIRTLALQSQDNAVAANFANMIKHEGAAPELVMRAWRRYACSIARSSEAVFGKIDSPRIRDNVDLHPIIDTEGVVVLKDTAFLDNAHSNLIPEGEAAKGRAFCIYYRIHLDGFSALVMQDNGDNNLSFASWTRGQIRPAEDESELAWYLRGALWEALRPDADSDQAAEVSLLPAMERRAAREASGFRQSSRRIIAQVRMKPASMSIALRTVSEWFDEQVERHGDNLISDTREQGDWTIEHISNDRGVESLWSVSVLTPESDPNSVDVIVQTTLATGVKPRLPTIVRRIATATPTEGPDGLLRVRPAYVKSKGEVLELIRELQSEDRTLPILVMTQDEHGEYLKDPSEVAQQGLGALTVKTIAHNMTYELTDRLGQEYRTFGGAVRLFQPGFDPDRDTASRHPRIMLDTMAERTLSALISRATGATVTRYNIPEALRPTRTISQAPAVPAVVNPKIAAEPAPDKLAPEQPAKRLEAINDLPDSIKTGEGEKRAEKDTFTKDPSKKSLVNITVDDGRSSVVRKENEPTPARILQNETAPQDHQTSEAEIVVDDKAPEVNADAAETEDAPAPRRDTSLSVPGLDAQQIENIFGKALDERLTALGLGTLRQDLTSLLSGISKVGRITGDEKDEEILTLREELRIERESSVQLLDEADAERRAALLEVDSLRQALNDRRRAANNKGKQEYPDDLSGLGHWIDQNVLPNVVITSKAWRSMRNVDYRDMERLCETLKLLDGAYIDMRAGEEGAREEWQEGLQRLRLEDKKQTRMGRAARESDYQFTHEGEPWVVERHLRGNESLHNDHTRLLRIYYTYDPDRARVLICSMPRHAHTRDS